MALDRKNLPQAPGGQAQTGPGGTRTQQGPLPAAPKPQSGPIVPPPQQPGPGIPPVRGTAPSGASDNPAGKLPPAITQTIIPQFPPPAPTLPPAPAQSMMSVPGTGGVDTATVPAVTAQGTGGAAGTYVPRLGGALPSVAKTTAPPAPPPVEAKGGYVKGANGQIDWAATMANWDKQRNDYQAALAGGASIPEAAAQVGAATSAYSGPNASAYQALNNRINAAGLGGFGEGQNALPTAIGQIFNVVMKNGGSAQDAADIVFNYLQSGGGNAPGHLTGKNAFELFARTHDGGQALLTQIAKNPAAFGLGTGKIVNPTGDTNFYGYNPDGSKMTAAQGKAAAQAKRDAWLRTLKEAPQFQPGEGDVTPTGQTVLKPNQYFGSNGAVLPKGSEVTGGWWQRPGGEWTWTDHPKPPGVSDKDWFDQMMAEKRKTKPQGYGALRDTNQTSTTGQPGGGSTAGTTNA